MAAGFNFDVGMFVLTDRICTTCAVRAGNRFMHTLALAASLEISWWPVKPGLPESGWGVSGDNRKLGLPQCFAICVTDRFRSMARSAISWSNDMAVNDTACQLRIATPESHAEASASILAGVAATFERINLAATVGTEGRLSGVVFDSKRRARHACSETPTHMAEFSLESDVQLVHIF